MKTFKRTILNVSFASLLLVASLVISSNLSLAYEKEVGRLSAIMIDKISKSGKQLVAVVDFNDLHGNITELGRFLAEEFSSALSNNESGFKVIERIHLRNIIKEHKLSSSGIIDLSTAQKLGRISGVEALVIGTITPMGDRVRLSVKVLDTEDAKVINSTSGYIPKTRAIEELLERDIEDKRAPSGRPTPKPHARGSKGISVEAEGFTFTPVRCTRSGGTLTCTISFRNNTKVDREVRINSGRHRETYLADNNGRKHYPELSVGGRRTRLGITDIFVPNVPANVNFIADNINPKSTHITAVISIEERGEREREWGQLVVLRDIPITN
jgi:TolB-like protein